MKLEFRVSGKFFAVESDGFISLQVWDEDEVVAPVPVSVPAVSVPVAAAPVAAPALRSVPSAPAAGDELFARLCGLRRRLAAEKGAPPYVIFHDKTLRQIVDDMPSDLDEFSRIGGVGQAKLEKYGQQFLEVLHQGVAG